MGHVTYTQEMNATPEQVWTILSDATRLPDWAYTEGRYPHPVEGKYGSEQKEGAGTLWIGVAADGQQATQKVTVWEAPKRLVYELEAAEEAPLKMTQVNSFDLTATGDSTQVTWDVEWSVASGFSLSSLLICFTGNGAFEEMMAGSLENLKELVESEASVEPVEVIEGDG